MSRVKKDEGELGERLASEFLKKLGYKIVTTNFRIRNGEIDIIAIDNAKKEKSLVFIEVKTRKSTTFGTPFEAIGFYKLKALTNAAQVYKFSHVGVPNLLRIDAIAITLNSHDEVINLEHIKNITG